MTNSYNTSLEETALLNIGRQYRVAARVLANLGLYAPSSFCMFQALENYLKACHSKNNRFASKQEWENLMKSYSHNLEKLYDDLPESVKKSTKHGFSVAKHAPTRYEGSFAFSNGWFRESEMFLYKIGLLLGEKKRKSQYDDWLSVTHPNIFRRRGKKMDSAIKSVLSVSDKPSKSERIKETREKKNMLANLAKSIKEMLFNDV